MTAQARLRGVFLFPLFSKWYSICCYTWPNLSNIDISDAAAANSKDIVLIMCQALP